MPEVVYVEKASISTVGGELNRLYSGLHHLRNVPGISSAHLDAVKALQAQLDSLNDKTSQVFHGELKGSDFADQYEAIVDSVLEQTEAILDAYEPDEVAQNWPKAKVCLRRSWGQPPPEPLQLNVVSDADILAEVQRRMQERGTAEMRRHVTKATATTQAANGFF